MADYNPKKHNNTSFEDARPDECILVQAKNYCVINRSIGFFPKLKAKGITFKGDFCRYVDPSKIPEELTKDVHDYYQPIGEDPLRYYDTLV